ncbi:MAG: hypothetical protein IKA53_06670 [Clostridia bacterium]|nr:hypothetical protein [Clostridia bacterium]MBR2325710.1 hypothetical protein [Clostridia bacterium]
MNAAVSMDSIQPMLLCEIEKEIAGISLTYRLFVTYQNRKPRFSVCVRTADQSEAELGEDFFQAITRFQMLTEQAVTPCTLHDVLCDLRCLENF